jgi:hypothetical protein
MKKGAALSLVLAPGGTAMFWVTQGACARAAGMSETAEINAPRGRPTICASSSPGEDESHWLAFTGTMTSGRRTVNDGPP